MIFFFISLSTYFCYLILKYRQGLMALENEKYDLKKYSKWIIKNGKENFLTLELLAIILIIIAFNFDAKVMGVSMVIFYTFTYLFTLRKQEGKFKFKAPNVRISIISIIIYALILGLFCLDYQYLQSGDLLFDHSKFYYIAVILLGYIAYFIILLSAFIDKPIELLIKKIKKNKKNKK